MKILSKLSISSVKADFTCVGAHVELARHPDTRHVFVPSWRISDALRQAGMEPSPYFIEVYGVGVDVIYQSDKAEDIEAVAAEMVK